MTNDAMGRSWERRVQKAGARAEAELRLAIQYLNDEVVPEVRRSGSGALRSVALELHRLADQMAAGPAPRRDAKEKSGQ